MNELLIESLSIMFIGIGTVLSFLCLMIISMFIMSDVIKKLNKIFPEAVAVGSEVKKTVTASDDSEIAAAIVTAFARGTR